MIAKVPDDADSFISDFPTSRDESFKVVVNGVRYLLDRCGFVPAMLFVIVMSSFHHAQCMKQKISFTN